MIIKQLGSMFSSHVFHFIGTGGKMAAAFFHGEPGAISVSAPAPEVVLSYASAVLLNNPLGYWRLSETTGSTAVDEMGLYDGDYTNGVELQVDPLITDDPVDAFGVRVDGVDDVVDFPYAIISAASDVTIEAWVSPVSTRSRCFLARGQDGSGSGWNMLLSMHDGGGAGLAFSIITASPIFQYGAAMQGGISAVVSAPYHLLGVYSQGNRIQMYCNGVNVASTIVTATGLRTSGKYFNLGDYAQATQNAHCRYDEAAVYGSALNPAQIRRTYLAGKGYASSTYPATIIRDGARAYYRLDDAGTRAFAMTGGYSGTFVGTVSKGATSLIAENNGAMGLSGVASSGVMLTSADIFPRNGSHTLETWFQLAAASANSALISKEYNGIEWPEYVLRVTSDGVVRYSLSSADTPGGNHVLLSDVSTMFDGEIHHVAAVHDNPGNTMRLFVDGMFRGSATFAGDTWDSTNRTTIGYTKASASTMPLNGIIDEVAIYGSALTEDTVRDHVARGRGHSINTYPFEVITDGANGYWRFQENDGAPYARSDTGSRRGAYVGTTSLGDGLVAGGGKSLILTGVASSGVSLGDVAMFDRTGSHTLEAWFSASASGVQSLIRKQLAFTNFAEYGISISGGNGISYFVASANTAGGEHVIRATTSTFNDGEVHHVVAVHDNPGNSIRLYADGVLHASATFNGDVYTGTDPLTLAYSHSASLTFPLDGALDEVGIYGTAITEAAVRRHLAYGRGHSMTSYPFEVITDGVVGYWQLDEANGATYARAEAGTRRGTYIGTVSAGAVPLTAGSDSSLVLTGVASSGVSFGDVDMFDRTGSHSIEGWFKTTGSTAFQTIVNKGYTGIDFPEYNLSVLAGGGIRYAVSSADTAGGFYTAVSPASAYNDGAIHHVVGVHDNSAGAITLYVDGSAVASTTFPGDLYDGGQPVSIGYSKSSGDTRAFDGTLDEIAVYASALTSTQVASHYLKGLVLPTTYASTVTGDGAIHYWKFDEAAGTATVADSLGSFDGTLKVTASAGASSLIAGDGGSITSEAIASSMVRLGDVDLFRHTGSHSLEGWFRTADTSAGTRQLFKKGKPGQTWDEYAVTMFNSGTIRYALGSANTAGGVHIASSPHPQTDGAIHHFVAVHDNPNNHMRLYIDGLMHASATFESDIWFSTEDVTFGGTVGLVSTNTGPWVGEYDEYAVYQLALTDRQIRNHNLVGRGYASSTYQYQVMNDGAVGYWGLDEANGASSPVAVVGGIGEYIGTVSAGASGIVTDSGGALALSAVASSGIKVGNVNFFEPEGSHSIEAWFRTTSSTTSQNMMGRGNGALSTPQYQLSMSSGGSVTYAIASASSTAHTVNSPASTYNDGNIHHIVGVHNNEDNYIRLFMDGALVASATMSGNVFTSDRDLTLGYNTGVPREFNGTLDEMAIYATALTEAQVSSHYVAGT